MSTEIINAKLVMAKADIEAVLKKYDIAGVVILQNPQGTDVVLNLTPTYVAAEMVGTSFRCRQPTDPVYPYEPNPLEVNRDALRRRETIFNTVNMVVNLGIVAANVLVALQQAEKHAREFFNLQPPKKGGPPKITTP